MQDVRMNGHQADGHDADAHDADGHDADGHDADGHDADQRTEHDPADRHSVAEWISGWGREVATADIAAGRRRFATDLSAFGTHADVVHGRDAVEERQWAQIWPAIEDFAFDVDDLDVIVSPDRRQAVAVVTWSSTGIGADGTRFDRPGRATVVLTRPDVGVPWRGVHTHFSLARGVPDGTYGRREATR
jgi:ketosteroid isomerase-like protein